ncbi:hypothetical protein B5J94_02715 [Moraxella lacunata]|uniref:Uncharacterized protein n=1 Tax=Moraxella lacunata TaxID=477 RepID=A0A1V4H2W4_MORLA|nr:hypothetical protein B5J94_02715 [Moraxella lacunata]
MFNQTVRSPDLYLAISRCGHDGCLAKNLWILLKKHFQVKVFYNIVFLMVFMSVVVISYGLSVIIENELVFNIFLKSYPQICHWLIFYFNIKIIIIKDWYFCG